jgi:signal transduction histidine kinase
MRRAPSNLWYAAAVLGPLAVAIGELGFFLNDLAPEETLILDLAVGSVSVLAGLLLWRLFPDNPTGLLLYLAGVLWAVPGIRSLGQPLLFGIGEALSGAQDAVFAHLLLAYPSGRLTSRPARVMVALAYSTVALGFARTLVYGPLACGCLGFPNGLLVRDWPAAHNALGIAGSGLALVVTVMAIGILARRWNQAGTLGRRTYSPVLGVALLLAFSILLLTVTEEVMETVPRWMLLTTVVARLLVPLAFLAGLIRSTFDRAAVGNLVIGLESDSSRSMQEVLMATLHDPSLVVAYWVPERDGYFDANGMPVSIPEDESDESTTLIGSGGERLAVLVHDPALRSDPVRIEAAVSAARMVIQRERLQAQVLAQLEEVRASRARIVEAGEIERRRVERDLHDGAQQRLLALALSIRLTREQSGEVHIRDLLADAGEEASATLADLRELAQGIYPSVLTAEGLGPAIETLAERAPMPVEVEVDETRFSGTVETTAYFAVSEALANATKHASAAKATVRSSVRNGSLTVEIEDDGRGGASIGKGTGLRGIADRVAAYNGTFDVTSPPGKGTVIRVELPIG